MQKSSFSLKTFPPPSKSARNVLPVYSPPKVGHNDAVNDWPPHALMPQFIIFCESEEVFDAEKDGHEKIGVPGVGDKLAAGFMVGELRRTGNDATPLVPLITICPLHVVFWKQPWRSTNTGQLSLEPGTVYVITADPSPGPHNGESSLLDNKRPAVVTSDANVLPVYDAHESAVNVEPPQAVIPQLTKFTRALFVLVARNAGQLKS
jgi:hypothetical protein